MDPHILDAVIVILVTWRIPLYLLYVKNKPGINLCWVHSNINYYDLNPNLDVGIAMIFLGLGM